MAVNVIDTLKPKNNGSFPIVEAQDVAMPDGTRLSENNFGNYKITEGTPEIEPGKYYVFGEVSELAVSLIDGDETTANEYVFEFVPMEGFAGLTITPEPAWIAPPQYPKGKTCQVSILRGLAVMGCG